jgi:type IV pilus assembly protein PilY1
VIGRPQLLKLNIGTATTPVYRYFAVVASGVNNHVADGRASTGEAALFFLRLDKAKSAAWVEGTGSGANYFKIVFPRTGATLVSGLTIASGMVGFTALKGAAGEVTYLYGGDLQGNVWKLNMSAFVAGTAASVDAFSYYKNASNEALPMYTAADADGNRQPISMEPAVAFGSGRTLIVSFGTGKFLETTDNAGPYRAQSVYSLLDDNTPTLDSTGTPTAAISGRGRLMAGTSGATGVSIPDFAWGRPTVDNSTASRSGWYFDFYGSQTTTTPVNAGTGERQISNFAILAGRLIFGTVIPAADSCSNGDGNLYIVDLKTGDAVSAASTVGILGEPFLVQVGASSLSVSDTTGRRRESARYQVILQGSGGSAAPGSLGIDVVTFPGRLSWREISNYQELRNGS